MIVEDGRHDVCVVSQLIVVRWHAETHPRAKVLIHIDDVSQDATVATEEEALPPSMGSGRGPKAAIEGQLGLPPAVARGMGLASTSKGAIMLQEALGGLWAQGSEEQIGVTYYILRRFVGVRVRRMDEVRVTVHKPWDFYARVRSSARLVPRPTGRIHVIWTRE